MAQFQYNPTDGFKNTASFPNPTTQEGGREQIQSLMDQARDAINAVDTDLQAEKEELAKTDGVGGSALIGSPPISGVTGTTVKDQLVSLKGAIDQTSLGQIADGSLTDVKLSDTAGQIKDRFSKHAADNLYQTAGGTATALTLTISETLVNGLPITFIASANNNGAATTINGKSLYKPNTITAPTLISGKAYTIWYSSVGTCFFIKASAEGTAVAGNVLAGKTFSNDSDTGLVGAMPNKTGTQTTAAGIGTVSNGTIPVYPSSGYYDGSSSISNITDSNFIPPNIISGKSIFGVIGTGRVFTVGDAYAIDQGKSNTKGVSPWGPLTKKAEVQINIAGTYRIKFYLSGWTVNVVTTGRIYKNDAPYGTTRTATGVTYDNPMLFTEDLAFNAGDRASVYISSTVDNGYVSGLAVCYSVPEASSIATSIL